jgi:spore coat polysaccharide biosynthesis protein SpsF (cytidylyltransferase family)
VALSEDLAAENGSIVVPRIKESNIICNIESELEFSEKQLAILKETYTEDLVKEVSIRGSPADILKRVLNILDPFYTKFDEESTIRVSADLPESGYGHIPWGDYADYCPVSF